MSINLIQLKDLIKSVVKEHTRKTRSGKISQVRQHEDKRKKKTVESKAMSSGLSSIVNEVAKHDSVKSAYAAFKHRAGIPREVADEFFQKFGEKGALDPEEAFKNLYDYAKRQGRGKGEKKKDLNKIKKEGKNYVLWSDVNSDFSTAKKIVYNLLGKKEVDGDHSINMNFHFILDNKQFDKLKDSLRRQKSMKKSVASSGIYLIKSRVKGHTRKLKSGKAVQVREHVDSRKKKTATVGEGGYKTWYDTEAHANKDMATMKKEGFDPAYVAEAYHSESGGTKFKIYRSREELAKVNAAFRAKGEAILAEKQKVEDAKLDVNGFGADLKPMNRTRAVTALNKQIKAEGKLTTLKDFVRKLVKKGGELSIEEVVANKPMSRTKFNRSSEREQELHVKKMKEAGKKKVYYVDDYDLGKTAYDYAQHLKKRH